MIIDSTDDFLIRGEIIPAIRPVPYRWDARGPERSTFAQSDAEKRDALHLRTRYDYDDKQEALVVYLYRNELLIGKVNEALGYYRNLGKTVRKILLFVHPESYQNGFLLFDRLGFERNERYESSNNGNFALVKTLKVRAKQGGETQKGEEK